MSQPTEAETQLMDIFNQVAADIKTDNKDQITVNEDNLQKTHDNSDILHRAEYLENSQRDKPAQEIQKFDKYKLTNSDNNNNNNLINAKNNQNIIIENTEDTLQLENLETQQPSFQSSHTTNTNQNSSNNLDKYRENTDNLDQQQYQQQQISGTQIMSGQASYNYQLNKQKNQQKKKKQNQQQKIVFEQKGNQISKQDFKFDKQNKVANILMDEEEIGEVGEMIEKTTNANYQNNYDEDDIDSEEQHQKNNEDDEFDQAFEDGKNTGIDFKSPSNKLQQPQDLLTIEANKKREQEIQLAKQKAQQKAQQKLKGRTTELGTRTGFMVNKLSSKATIIKVKDEIKGENKHQQQTEQPLQKLQEIELAQQQKQMEPEHGQLIIQEDEDDDLEEQKQNQKSSQEQQKQNQDDDQKIIVQLDEQQQNNIDDKNNNLVIQEQQTNDDEVIQITTLNKQDSISEPVMQNKGNKQLNKYDNQEADIIKEKQDNVFEMNMALSPDEMRRMSDEKHNKQITEDEWDMISKQTLQMQAHQLHSQKQVQAIQYIEAWNKVKSQDLTQQMKLLHSQEITEQSFFSRLFQFCSKSSSRLHKPLLMRERDTILAYATIKFDDKDHFHFQMIYSIFFQLTDNKQCLRYGSHWEKIGFQGTDPASDIRGGGMFGVLQILAFVSHHKLYLQDVLEYSHHETYNFPLAVTLFNVTSDVIKLLKDGRLNDMINAEKQVMSILNLVYFASFHLFFESYKQQKCTIHQFNTCFKQAKEVVYTNPKRVVNNFRKRIDKFYKNRDD